MVQPQPQTTLFDASQPESDRQENLAAAFAFFNETSEQLSRSYRMLEDKVKQLTEELERVSAEREDEHLKKQQLANRMQALLDFLPGGVIVLDSRGYIVEANPAAHNLLESKLCGRLWRQVIGECFSPRNDDGLEVSTRSGRRISVATSSLEPQLHSAQQLSGGQIILLTDLTETRKLQQHVSRSERLSAMGKMVSALAHQIRTPLSAAILYADHLCHDGLTQHKREDFSRKLFSRLQHMERQVRDMLLFVKSELPLNDIITVADLEMGLREAAEVPLQSSSSRCSWNNLVPTLELKCHRDALISAIINLLNNGIQACEGAAELQLSLSQNGKVLQLCLRDNGLGMSPEVLAASREIFMTTKPQGTGLGLAVVQSVVRAHGGSFELQSAEGEGTCAVVCLPLYDANKH